MATDVSIRYVRMWNRGCICRAELRHPRIDISRRRQGEPPVSPSPPGNIVDCSVKCSVSCVTSFTMASTTFWICTMVIACASIRQTLSAPAPQEESASPMPYEYKYDVEDQEKTLFFGANEVGDAAGKVTGGYKVLLPDGRLMTVEYTVEGESGFVPKITFEENANPFGKGK